MLKEPYHIPQQPSQLDPSWSDTGQLPAIPQISGLSTWAQMEQPQKSPITPAPKNWHDDLPKPVYKQWSMPREKMPFDFDKFSAYAMKVTVIVFAFLFLLICLIKALVDFAFMK